jgi:beta-lactamase regulating signal transducer with metallopeptidase domain
MKGVAVSTLLHIGLTNAVLAGVLALAVGCIGCVCRRPALMHCLWLLVLLKLVTPPLFAVPVLQSPEPESANESTPLAAGRAPDALVPARRQPPPSSAGLTGAPVPDINGLHSSPLVPEHVSPPEPIEGATPTMSWETIVGAVWLTGCLGWWGLALYRIGRFRSLLRHASAAPPGLQEQAGQVARRLGLTWCPRVWLVPAPIPPLLWAVAGSARILLPAALWQRCTIDQQQTFLAHELAHLRRRDHWARRLELLVGGLYWWHPVVWWARHALREAEEQCCDAWVVWALPNAASAYATGLVETVAFLSQARSAPLAAASGLGHVHSLKRRVTMIMRGTPPRALSAAGFLVVLALGAILLPLLPTRAEEGAEPKARPGLRNVDRQPRRQQTDTAPVPNRAVGEKPDPQPLGEEDENPKPAPRTGGKQRGPAPRVTGTSVVGAAVSKEEIEKASEEVELLEVQLQAKQADVQEAEVQAKYAKLEATRASKLLERNARAISPEDVDATKSKLELCEARLKGKMALVQEVSIRLKHARRRLTRLQAATGIRPSDEKPSRNTGRMEELEKKLDALQDALKKLQLELRKAKHKPTRPAD